MEPLEQKIRDYYQDQSLSPEREEAILMALRQSSRKRQVLLRRIASVAAAVILLLGGLMFWHGRSRLPGSLERSIAGEVAMNHEKALPPEITTDAWSRIQAGLPKLKIPLSPTQSAFLEGYHIQGGRYCSIQGELAAQISLHDSEQRPATLYIAPLTSALRQTLPCVLQQDKTRIQLWHDAHRLFVLASDL